MAWQIERNDPLGELRLQSNDNGNIFFSEDIDHNNVNRDHPRTIGTFHGTFPNHNLCQKSEGFPVNIPIQNTILQAFYRDRFLSERAVQGSYEVFISIWYEEG